MQEVSAWIGLVQIDTGRKSREDKGNARDEERNALNVKDGDE